jgi:iron(III) transport system ATP-binding protein
MSETTTSTASEAKARADLPIVSVRSLEKSFRREDGSRTRAIDDVSLDVLPGEFVVLLGPSGCGKTTLLRSIAGLEEPDAGGIEIRGETVFSSEEGIDVAPERRRLAMIFQSYALWPHMTAFQNVAYPLQGRRVRKKEIAERVGAVFGLVGIPELQQQYPGQMSGGQQQRVALARALVAGGDLVLFDEPLSNVDAKVREQLRFELLSMQRELGFAAVYVTHDQAEAMELAHRIAVMREGSIVQVAPPRTVYTEPATRYVANFVGTSNELEGTVTAVADGVAEIDTAIGRVRGVASEGISEHAPAIAMCRPERLRLAPTEPESPNRWHGEVRTSAFLGANIEHVVGVAGRSFRVWSVDTQLLDEGTEVWLFVEPEHVRVLPL